MNDTFKIIYKFYVPIGYHINRKNGSISNQMLSSTNKLFQIFCRSPINGSSIFSEDEIEKCKEIIKNKNLKCFIHAPYIINLSNPFTKKNLKDNSWIFNIIKEDLTIGKNMGCYGVVIHVGKYLNNSIENAINIMTDSIRKILENASEKCPLILETPAGQGSELLTDLNDLIKYYNSFTEKERKIFKICVDTCHVFASGYNPIEYIENFYEKCGKESIVLIHFNDSSTIKGSRKDRHKLYGNGYIGKEELNKVARWAYVNDIPLIIE